MSNIILELKPEFEKPLSFLAKELASLNTGRANPNSIEHLGITAYGNTTMTLRELASIGVPEARVLVVTPWDKTIMKDIAKSLTEANLGFQVITEADKIRLVVPQLTEESRKEYLKLLKEKMEKARVSVRQVRERAREKINTMSEEKAISEDEKFKLLKELDASTHTYVKEIEAIGARKSEELTSL